MTKVGWYALGKSTPLESNKSHYGNPEAPCATCRTWPGMPAWP
jgi:hypothetical protein